MWRILWTLLCNPSILRDYLILRLRPWIFSIFGGGVLASDDGKHLDIEYWVEAQKHIIRVPISRGPHRMVNFFCVKDGAESKNPRILLDRLGPSKNFHGVRTTPRMLGFDSVEIEFPLEDSEGFIFGEDEEIVLESYRDPEE